MDYLQEPDVFHDVLGHVPHADPPGLRRLHGGLWPGRPQGGRQGAYSHHLARLYWYTVEFGLIRREEGMRIYGAGILSSLLRNPLLPWRTPRPAAPRLRPLRGSCAPTTVIDRFQDTYFVIDGFDQLFAATKPDFTPLYAALAGQPTLAPDATAEGDSEVSLELA